MKKKRNVRSDGKVLFLFLGVVLTLLLVGVLLQQSIGKRTFVGEAPSLGEVDPTAVLPEGISNPAMSAIEPSIDPAYVFAYEIDGGIGVALVAWDRKEGVYHLLSSLQPADVGMYGNQTEPTVAVRNDSWGIDPVFVVTARQEGEAFISALVTRQENTLRIVRMRDSDGSIRPAILPSGTLLGYAANHQFEDVDGDGVGDVVMTRAQIVSDGLGGHQLKGRDVRVMRWDGSVLSFDERLTWSFTLANGLFPDPIEQIDEVSQDDAPPPHMGDPIE